MKEAIEEKNISDLYSCCDLGFTCLDQFQNQIGSFAG